MIPNEYEKKVQLTEQDYRQMAHDDVDKLANIYESFTRSLAFGNELLKNSYIEMINITLKSGYLSLSYSQKNLQKASFLTRWYWKKSVKKWTLEINRLEKLLKEER